MEEVNGLAIDVIGAGVDTVSTGSKQIIWIKLLHFRERETNHITEYFFNLLYFHILFNKNLIFQHLEWI